MKVLKQEVQISALSNVLPLTMVEFILHDGADWDTRSSWAPRTCRSASDVPLMWASPLLPSRVYQPILRRPRSIYQKVVQGKYPLHFLPFNGAVCSNTLLSNTSALTLSRLFLANSTCRGSRTPRLVEHFWVPIWGASCLTKILVGTLRPSHIPSHKQPCPLLEGGGKQDIFQESYSNPRPLPFAKVWPSRAWKLVYTPHICMIDTSHLHDMHLQFAWHTHPICIAMPKTGQVRIRQGQARKYVWGQGHLRGTSKLSTVDTDLKQHLS